MRGKKISKEIMIEINGVRKRVATVEYISAKTKQLQEFGYSSLTKAEVERQLSVVLSKKREHLTVIGMFMENEVIS